MDLDATQPGTIVTVTTATQGFATVLERWPVDRVRGLVYEQSDREVERALRSSQVRARELAALLSPAATPFLEQLALKSAAITRRRFGRTMQFYVPLYVSNHCCNACVYCGFNRDNRVPRRALSLDEACQESETLANMGFRHLLLVAGDDRSGVPVEYFEELAQRLAHRFASLSIEIYALNEKEYAQLVGAGVDSMTLYQETYDLDAYAQVHPSGPKQDYFWRLLAPERAAHAGIAFLGIGALLGLVDWRVDAFYVGLHAQYLQRRYWRQHVSVSFPRLRQAAGGIDSPFPVTDVDLVQMLTAGKSPCV